MRHYTRRFALESTLSNTASSSAAKRRNYTLLFAAVNPNVFRPNPGRVMQVWSYGSSNHIRRHQARNFLLRGIADATIQRDFTA